MAVKEIAAKESKRREKRRSRVEKATALKTPKRDPGCPWCHVRKYGLRRSIERLFNRVCWTP